MKLNLQFEIPAIAQAVTMICEAIRAAGGRALLVGGCVRDALLDLPAKDADIECYGLEPEFLTHLLEQRFQINAVGKSFGVIKIHDLPLDISIPRRESKSGLGHKGFEVFSDPYLSPIEAAKRRDFTINAIAYDPLTGEVIDPFGGRQDMERRLLRHTSTQFAEDPLRVLRGMQFVSRFDLQPAPETLALCRQIRKCFRELSVERVWEEWSKWAEKSRVPSAGLKFLAGTGWIEHFPELHALVGMRQDPAWHPEGDVFTHTCHCLDALVTLPEWQTADTESRTVYSMAVLTHDLAKPQTTQTIEKSGRERIISPGHEEAGGPLARAFLERINAPIIIRERVVPLVTHHLAHLNPITDRSVRRLARRLEPETIASLCLVMTADQFGRPPLPRIVPDGVTVLRTTAEALQVQSGAPRPVLMGRHLIELGMAPGTSMGVILQAAYEAQLDGKFTGLKEALPWLSQESDLELPPAVRDALSAQINTAGRLPNGKPGA